jgi:predicted DNA-binding antitoxin AbrB/MazE fold protein
MTTIEAVYKNGVLRPCEPLPFSEGQTVDVTVTAKRVIPVLDPEE